MRLIGLVVVVALGCSSNNFYINEAPEPLPDTGAARDSHASVDTSSADVPVAPDTTMPPSDTSTATDVAPLLDTTVPPAEASVGCARNGDCPASEYCKYSGCGTMSGICTVLSPLPGPYYNPVCACDGTTMWNREFAYVNSVPILHPGVCTTAEKKACVGAGTLCDTPDSVCVVELPSASACSISTATGACWRLPTGTLCSGGGGPPVLTCGGTCLSTCGAVKAKTMFYGASCVPPG